MEYFGVLGEEEKRVLKTLRIKFRERERKKERNKERERERN